jgi:REP element-mobilizing transposase RayT
MRAWVVMPNHVHVVIWPKPPNTLSGILHSWKSFTAHEINKLLPEKAVPFWQRESYDHLIRDEDELGRCCQYTLMNPVNAGLCAEGHLWRWSSGYEAQASSGVEH